MIFPLSLVMSDACLYFESLSLFNYSSSQKVRLPSALISSFSFVFPRPPLSLINALPSQMAFAVPVFLLLSVSAVDDVCH